MGQRDVRCTLVHAFIPEPWLLQVLHVIFQCRHELLVTHKICLYTRLYERNFTYLHPLLPYSFSAAWDTSSLLPGWHHSMSMVTDS